MSHSLPVSSTNTLHPPAYLVWSDDVSGIAAQTLSNCVTDIESIADVEVGLIKPFAVLITDDDKAQVTFSIRMFRYRSGWIIGTLEAKNNQATLVQARVGIDPGILFWLAGILIVGLCVFVYAIITAAPGLFGIGMMITGIPITELLHGISGTKRELKVIFKETLELK